MLNEQCEAARVGLNLFAPCIIHVALRVRARASVFPCVCSYLSRQRCALINVWKYCGRNKNGLASAEREIVSFSWNLFSFGVISERERKRERERERAHGWSSFSLLHVHSDVSSGIYRVALIRGGNKGKSTSPGTPGKRSRGEEEAKGRT